MLLSIETLLAVILFLQNVSFAKAIDRTVGPTYDPLFQNITRLCNGTDPESFNFGNCTLLIDCVYGNITPSFSQTLSIGGGIAGLLPTILVLLGLPFLDLLGWVFLRFTEKSCFLTGSPLLS
jgi:hypothetical protein